jgi:hypothetical protein
MTFDNFYISYSFYITFGGKVIFFAVGPNNAFAKNETYGVCPEEISKLMAASLDARFS